MRNISVTLLVCLLYSTVYALPDQFVHEGLLTSANGVPISTTAQMRIRLYPTALGNQVLFEEIHPQVEVINGYFVIWVGSQEPLDPSLFERSELFLGVRINNDDELTPRTEFFQAPSTCTILPST